MSAGFLRLAAELKLEDNMGIKDLAWKAAKWKIMKKQLGYDDEEMRVFRENPRNEDVLSKVPDLMGKTIIYVREMDGERLRRAAGLGAGAPDVERGSQ